MKHASKLLGAAGTAALMGLVATPAFAVGTTAGTSITNTVAVNFQVGGVAQTATSASNTIVVDAKIVLTALEQNATTSVSPGQTNAVTTFKITNSSNETIDVGLLAAAQSIGATAAHGGTVAATATSYTYWLDTSGTGVYNSGTVTQVTWLDQLPADTSKTVFVLATIPAGVTNGQVAGIDLTATAESAGTPGTQGSALTASSGAWTPGTVQTVLADAAGNGGDAAYDGKYTALADYTVAAPVLSVNKNSLVLLDPVDGSTNPKAIPGATLQYCIVVANASTAGATATNLNISDVLPTYVTYKASSVVLNAAVTGSGATATCGSGTAGVDSTNFSATPTPTVSGSLSNLAPGSSEGLSFSVTIN